MTPDVPISAEQWALLRKLDKVANVTMRRADARGRNPEHPRTWFVSIIPRNAEEPHFYGVRVERATLAAAVREALFQAEHSRWAQAAPPRNPPDSG